MKRKKVRVRISKREAPAYDPLITFSRWVLNAFAFAAVLFFLHLKFKLF